MNESKYLDLRRNAKIVPDNGGYILERAQMNPSILDMAIALISSRGLLNRVWEPFAGSTSEKFRLLSEMRGFEMRSSGLCPGECTDVMDSTKNRPKGQFGMVIMHPPYYGSDAQSDSDMELSKVKDWDDYSEALIGAFRNAVEALVDGGLIVAIGRDYRALSKRIRLDLLYVDIMDKLSLELDEVWTSEPDVVLIARK